MIWTRPTNGQFYFGRNKVQYEQFRWQVMASTHFDIYFYDGEEKIAQAAIYYAETFFDSLETRFNYIVEQRIPLVVYSNQIHFQETNILSMLIPEGVGGFFEFIKQRVVIPFSGDMYEFKKVIHHELVHVFMYHKIAATANNLGLWDVPYPPLWFSEGLAEYWSRGWEPEAELILRDAVLNDYLLPLNSFELMSTGYLLYKEGQSFIRYFENAYGIDRLRALMEEYWQYNNFEDAMSAICDRKFTSIEEDWKISLKRDFARSLPDQEVIQFGDDQVTRKGVNVSPTCYTDSNGRKRIVYLTARSGYTDIDEHSPADSSIRCLVRGERKADNESLHFLQTGIAVNSQGTLAYVCKSGARDAIRLVDLKTRKEIGSVQNLEMVTIRSPKWSSNGKQIVFSAQDFSGKSDLYLWEIPANLVTRLTDDFYADADPCFSSNDEFIIFSSDRSRPEPDGGSDLFLFELSTNSIFQITNDRYKEIKPIWTSEQPGIVTYLSDRSGTMNIWTLGFSSVEQLMNHEAVTMQKTNYHTGIQDVFPTSDSALVSVFQKYSFQIYHFPLNREYQTIALSQSPPVPDSTWKFPAATGLIQKKKLPYRMKYSLDFAQTSIAYDPIYGFLGGAQLSVSDLLGNRYYHFLLANTAQTTSELMDRFNVALTMVDMSRRSNYAIGAFHFANDYYDSYQGYYFERSIGIRSGLNFPIDTFRRLEFSMSLWESMKDFYFDKREKAMLVSNFVSYVHDNSVWTFTGPIDGWCLRITVGPTFNFRNSRIHNYTALGDLRWYYRFSEWLTFAQRSAFWFNEGTDIRRFYIGGSWGLRGYRINEIYGKKYMMLNQELRFPIAKRLIIEFGSTNIGLAPVRGALFFDVGNAWDYEFPGMIGSFGFGLRGVLLGSFVLRLDVGRKTDFHSIPKHWFTQFFFGWDY